MVKALRLLGLSASLAPANPTVGPLTQPRPRRIRLCADERRPAAQVLPTETADLVIVVIALSMAITLLFIINDQLVQPRFGAEPARRRHLSGMVNRW